MISLGEATVSKAESPAADIMAMLETLEKLMADFEDAGSDPI